MAWTEFTRRQHARVGDKYASDLTDAEWALIEPLMPPRKTNGRPRTTRLRDVFDAILYIASTGCQWRMLPNDFPAVSSVRGYFYAWRNDGLLDEPGIFIESHSDGVSGRFWRFGAAAMLAMAAATTGSRAERCREGAFRRPEVPLRCRRAFAAQDDASPMGVAGIRAAGLFAVRYGSGSAQCRAMSRGQSTAQNGAAADEIASTILRPEITSRAPARSTRSRRRRRLQPVPVACAMARRAMCMTSQARQEISNRTSLQAKASTAGVFDFGVLPRQCDFARLVEDSAGASTSFNSPMWPSALPRSR